MKIKTKSCIIDHRPAVHGGLASFIGRAGPKNIVDFSSNITPVGIPAKIKKRLGQKLGDDATIQDYPDLNCSKLLAGLAKYTKIPVQNLLVGNGAIEIIYNFASAFLSDKNNSVLIAAPTFSEYELASKLYGAKVKLFKTMNLVDDLDSFISVIPTGGCVFLCNPNNPTGTILDRTHLTKIVNAAKTKSCLVFVDECFIEMVPHSNQSMLKLVTQHNNLFVLRSFTKSFGLAGIRVGYAASSKKIVGILQKIKIPWSTNTLAQHAGLAALECTSHLAKSKNIIKKEYDYLYHKINAIPGFTCYDSSTVFILVKTKQNSTALQKKLLQKHKILVRDCKSFYGLDCHHIRIAIRTHPDNQRLVRALGGTA